MAAPRILVTSTPTPKRAATVIPDGGTAGWSLLAIIGVVFLGLGMLDIGLAWFPADFSSAEWEFGTITASANGLPLPALGLMLVMAGGVATGRRWQVRGAALTMALLAVVLIVIAVLYMTVVPIAIGAVDNPLVRTGLVKAVVKSLVLLLLFPTLFTWLAIRGWRRSSPR